MRTISFAGFQTTLNAQVTSLNARLIALDVSKAAIGVAAATLSLRVVTPLSRIKRAGIKADAAALQRILADYPAEVFVVGWPLNMDGTEGARCQSVRDSMVEIMKFLPDIPILFWDERLSTDDGDEMVDEYRDKLGTLTNRLGKKAGAARDHMAAKAILESFLGNLLT